MAELQINGNFRVVDNSTKLRTLKEINTLLTNLNNTITQLKPVSLYENTSGTNSNITLKETSANFNLIDIIYAKGEIYQSSRVWKPNGKTISLIIGYKMNDTDTQIQTPIIKFNNNTVTRISSGGVNLGTGGVVNGFTNNEVKIYKIIGYRISV